jgi:hypothetical protein
MVSRRRGGLSLTTPALLFTGAALDMAWILQAALPNGLSATSAYLSQWEAPAVAYSQWWRGCFTTSDIAVALAAVIALGHRRQMPRASAAGSWNLGWAALGVYGVATATSDAVPMRASDPTGSVDLGRYLTSPGSMSGHLVARLAALLPTLGTHTAASVLGGAALIVALYALTLSARAATIPVAIGGSRTRSAADLSTAGVSPLARLGFGALIVQLVSSMALVAAIVAHTGAGIVGRLELTSEAGALVLLALSANRDTCTICGHPEQMRDPDPRAVTSTPPGARS